MSEENTDSLIAALIKMSAIVEKNGEHIRATFTNPDIKVLPGKNNLVICNHDTLIDPLDPAEYEYEIFGNTGDIGNGKRIITLSPIGSQ